MSFTYYSRTDGTVKACQLTCENEQTIADALSKASTIGDLASLTATRSEKTGCLEYTFRYLGNTVLVSLKTWDWLVELPHGQYEIVSNDIFVRRYFRADVDYEIPILKRQSVKSGFLEYVNENFPELYANNFVPSVSPYEAVELKDISSNEKVITAQTGAAAIVGPVNAGQSGSATVGAEITLEFDQVQKPTAYMIGMHGDSYNAPTGWTITAYPPSGEAVVITTVSPAELKSGIYKIAEPVQCTKLVFTLLSFEDPIAAFNAIRLMAFSGGEVIAPPTPVPLTKLSRDNLELVAEKLVTWYDAANNIYTMDLTTLGITDFYGFAHIYRNLLKASFIDQSTKVKIKLGNSIMQANVTDITMAVGFDIGTEYAGKIPNQFDPITLQQVVAELKKSGRAAAKRIIEIDFQPTQLCGIPAIQNCVTADTLALWNDFVENVITLTGISQPSQVKK